MDKWSPTNLVPLDKWSLEYSVCPGGQVVGIRKYGDHLCRGIVCPEGQEVGHRKSGDQMCRSLTEQLTQTLIFYKGFTK